MSLHQHGHVHKRTNNKTSSPKQQGSNTPGAHESSASLNVNLCKSSNFYKQTVSPTDAPTRRRVYTQQTLLHTDPFTRRCFLHRHTRCHTQTLLHADVFTRRCVLHTHTRFHTQTRLHTDALTHRRFYTQTLLHADAFYTRTHAFTHKRFYTQTLLHTNAFTHRHFYTQTLLHTGTCTQTKASIAILPQFLTCNVHFVRKGCD